MKKLTLIVSALAIVLGLSQCAKKPNAPVFGGVVREITFNATGGDAKGDFYQDGDQLRLKWQDGDKLYVYSSKSSECFDEETGAYLGALDILDGAGTEDAIFKGDIKVNGQIGYLRFVHVGQSIQVEKGEAKCNYSTQNGVIAAGGDNIAKKVMAHIDLPLSSGEYSGTLKTEYSVVEFKMDFFKGKTVTMTGYTNDVLTLKSNGSFEASRSEATSISLGEISKNLYYLVVLPEESTPTYKFYDGEDYYEKAATKPVEAGYFYSNSGSPIHIVDDDVLPGLFEVDKDGKKVHFSKGNLRYNAAKNKWSFADNQYDIVGEDNIKISKDYDGWIDLFGWGTGYATTEGGNQSYPWQNNMWYDPDQAAYYAVGHEKINDGSAVSANIYDWGHNIGEGNTWYTLTVSQWRWIFGPRNEEPNPGVNCRNTSVKINGGETYTYRYALVTIKGVHGLLAFPDTFNWVENTMGPAPKVFNTFDSDWNDNNYSEEQFIALQEAGAVFLPAAGSRGTKDPVVTQPVEIKTVNEMASYWTSTGNGGSKIQAMRFSFRNNSFSPGVGDYRCNGFSVRLVVDDENVSSGK